MSRTGKKPIQIPDKVKVTLSGKTIIAEGPLGKESVPVNEKSVVEVTDKQIVINRVDDSKESRSVHGLMRALVSNAVEGVSKGFKKDLEITGVGYRAEVKGQDLNLTLGFSHPIVYNIPKNITIKVDKQTKLEIVGPNKHLVGQVSAEIRSFRPPEPYKGKGVKYANETIIRKVGKAAGGK